MLQKNIERQERKARETWVGYYPRRTPTKKTKLERLGKKHKNKQALSRNSRQGSYFARTQDKNYLVTSC